MFEIRVPISYIVVTTLLFFSVRWVPHPPLQNFFCQKRPSLHLRGVFWKLQTYNAVAVLLCSFKFVMEHNLLSRAITKDLLTCFHFHAVVADLFLFRGCCRLRPQFARSLHTSVAPSHLSSLTSSFSLYDSYISFNFSWTLSIKPSSNVRVILILTKFGILISTWFQVVPFGV